MTDNPKILIVDDEPDILEFLRYNLEKESFEVFSATDGSSGLAKAKEVRPDLILLDVMMPGMDGMSVCGELRKDESFDDTIIAFLTARNEDYSQILGLETGADDYIAKPIRPRVLIARLKALLRRAKGEEVAEVIEVGGLKINVDEVTVYKEGEAIRLVKKEFELLKLLASRPGKVFSRDEIFRRVWGTDLIVGERTIDVHIRKLREKIGSEYISTLKGIGYKFEE